MNEQDFLDEEKQAIKRGGVDYAKGYIEGLKDQEQQIEGLEEQIKKRLKKLNKIRHIGSESECHVILGRIKELERLSKH